MSVSNVRTRFAPERLDGDARLRALAAAEREARERFEATFAQAAVGIVHVDLEGRFALVNDRACEILGYRREELLGRVVRELSHPGDGDKAIALRDQLVAGEIGTFSVEKRFLRKDGSPVWVNVTMSAARDAGGKPLYKIGVFEDITERKRTELRALHLSRMYAALSAVNEAIVRVKSPDALFQGVWQAVVASGAFKFAAIRMIDQETGWMHPVAISEETAVFAQAPISTREDLPEGRLPMAVAAREGRVVLVNDFRSDTALMSWHADAAKLGVHSVAYCPLRRGGRVVGALALLAGERDYFDDGMADLLRRLGENVSFALDSLDSEAERRSAEGALRDSEARFRSLADLSSDWYWELDSDLTYRSLRGKGLLEQEQAVIGKRREELPGMECSGEAWEEHRRNVGARRPFRDFVYSRVDASGTRRYISISGEPIFDARGELQGYRGTGREVTDAMHREAELRRFRAAMDMSGDLILLVDRATMRYVDVNDTACRLLGYTREELLAMGPQDILPATREELERIYDDMIGNGAGQVNGEIRLRCRNGELLPVEFTRHALRLGDRWIIAAISRDIRERIAAQDELRRFRVAMDHSADMIVLIDRAAMRFVDVNNTVCRILGYSRDELLQMGPQDVLPVGREELERSYDEFIADPSTLSGMKSQYRCKDGSLVPFESTRHVLKSGDSWIITAISRDIRERVAAEEALRKSNERLAYLAQFDELTGLPNRSLLRDRLEQAIAQAHRRRHSAAVLFVDLDRFKLVNDTLGHAAGDGLLAEAARRLKANVRAADTVGRISGDEFAVILADLAKPEDAEVVARKLIAALAAPFDLRGQEAFVSASIGIALTPDDGEDAETLLKHADAAMYRAKESGRNTFCFFTAELNRRAASRMRLAAELRHALERDEFRLHYQPKFDARTLELRGVEALLRWQHPVRGLVAPNDFVPVLEETGLIVPVGEWVLHEACRQLRVWQERGAAPLSVAVNISPRQFRHRQFARSVRTITHAAGVDPRHIELEITEGYLMEDPEEASRVLASLRDAGLRVSVDDFGTGYSSLSYLTRFPLTALKIDRSFVRKLGEEQSAEVLVRAIIDLAHNLGFEVVAEGVETERQLAFLRAHGCDQAQGYLLGRPGPEPEIAARLCDERGRPWHDASEDGSERPGRAA